MGRMNRVLLLSVPAFVLSVSLPAQSPAPSRKLESELSGSMFFGNTSQTLASARLAFERRDSTYGFRAGGRFHYGETTPEPAGTFVSKRAWEIVAQLEGPSFRAVAPYVRGSVSASLENRIARRYNIGVGTTYRAVETGGTDLIFSIGAAGEQTLPMIDSMPVTTLARGNTSVRLRRAFSSRVTMTNETTYQPAFRPTADFTMVSVTALQTRLSSFAALTLTFRDSYDSRAVSRGARVNNDGELLIGLLTSF
jgi:hypothetical protein